MAFHLRDAAGIMAARQAAGMIRDEHLVFT
jgi:hypothetical protein